MSAPWLAFVTPFQFGMPVFDRGASALMCLVLIVVMVEYMDMFLDIVDTG